MLKTTEEFEEKRHKFKIPRESIKGLAQEIDVEYYLRRELVRGKTLEEKDYEETRETVKVDCWLIKGSRVYVGFSVCNSKYDEISDAFSGGHGSIIDKKVLTILQKELPEYVRRILPKK